MFTTEETPKFRAVKIFDENRLIGTSKVRLTYAPNVAMRQLHAALLAALRSTAPRMPYATACRAGNSPKRNVEAHRRNTFFYVTDLEHAYQSVRPETLAEILSERIPQFFVRGPQMLLGFAAARRTLEFLSGYCIAPEGGLIVGAPTSQDLFNLYADVVLDRRLGPMCEAWGVTYTRYLDDITFSATTPIGKRKRAAIRDVVEEAGFSISHPKSHVFDLRRGPVVINGIGLELGGRLFLPRAYLNRTKGLLLLMRKGKVKRAVVAGVLSPFRQITPKPMNKTERRVHLLAQRLGFKSHPSRWQRS